MQRWLFVLLVAPLLLGGHSTQPQPIIHLCGTQHPLSDLYGELPGVLYFDRIVDRVDNQLVVEINRVSSDLQVSSMYPEEAGHYINPSLSKDGQLISFLAPSNYEILLWDLTNDQFLTLEIPDRFRRNVGNFDGVVSWKDPYVLSIVHSLDQFGFPSQVTNLYIDLDSLRIVDELDMEVTRPQTISDSELGELVGFSYSPSQQYRVELLSGGFDGTGFLYTLLIINEATVETVYEVPSSLTMRGSNLSPVWLSDESRVFVSYSLRPDGLEYYDTRLKLLERVPERFIEDESFEQSLNSEFGLFYVIGNQFGQPILSPDETRLAFSVFNGVTRETSLVIYNILENQFSVICQQGMQFDSDFSSFVQAYWSPDSQFLLLHDPENRDLSVFNLDTGDVYFSDGEFIGWVPTDQRVLDLVIRDETTGAIVQHLTENPTIKIHDMYTEDWAISAILRWEEQSSVQYHVLGNDVAYSSVVNNSPYNLVDDDGYSVLSTIPDIGSYELEVIPFTGENGTGYRGQELNVQLQVECEVIPSNRLIEAINEAILLKIPRICLEGETVYELDVQQGETVFATVAQTALIIDGNGAMLIVTGNQTRLFDVETSGELVLENLTLSNGNAGTGNGGAILNEGTLTLRDVNIYDSQAANGGAIYSTGTLTIDGGEFSRNAATVAGGAIYATGTFDIQNARIIDNTAPEGSAIYEGE